MSKKAVPDAWDDDWENSADHEPVSSQPAVENSPQILSKSQRLARHHEENRRLWNSAESSQTFHFLEARSDVPLKTEFKPAMTVLSRKPAPKIVQASDPVAGIARLKVEDENWDEEEDVQKKNTPTPEEQRQRAQREFAEKQRRYEEVRQRLFGTPDSGSPNSSPGTVTPPKVSPSPDSGRGNSRGGRGGGRGRGRGGRGGSHSGSRPASPALSGAPRGGRASREGSHDREGSSNRQLYDPISSPKPSSVFLQKRESRAGPAGMSSSPGPGDQQPIRAPRGPDGSGRGGFGFAPRGGRGG
ncbi:hypothetical protein L228DRAFT_235488 [Xylona heveae TC161]|uniref:SUZ-C domain-containing protein n=1 Tax=Xylona heveae (strain CBS 132557 / TC161) TaxID=1328760 RepID=A0A165JM14_XYLHT|nr:hypothetical protein L228DRAFT_235488 [Xylona heveae TC161]KZF26410.1 hypothetical protein L228DRAFT_235488 [Xylona heveae TC161]